MKRNIIMFFILLIALSAIVYITSLGSRKNDWTLIVYPYGSGTKPADIVIILGTESEGNCKGMSAPYLRGRPYAQAICTQGCAVQEIQGENKIHCKGIDLPN